MGRKAIQLKKCSECGKGLRTSNKSGLCAYHYRIKRDNLPGAREKRLAYAKKYRELITKSSNNS